MKVISTHIPEEMLRKGYYFHAEPNDEQYIIFLRTEKNHIVVEIKEFDSNSIDDTGEYPNKLDEIMCFDDGELIMEIDVWHKYYFPTFNNENNQWYHDDNGQSSNTIDTLHDLMKFGYDLAMKELITLQ